MTNIDDLLKIHENCKKTILDLDSNNTIAIDLLNKVYEHSNDEKIKDSINEIKAKTDAMMNFAKAGNLDEFMKLKTEMSNKYGRSN